ncbi:hypothetical protein DYU11_28255 [Fibrisoma montanum]|uniref:Uncharacterized protein n=1 Tax=Fibrisoma montanum TaxID=2305895 RepID=A0A418LYV9_9BACT|nr:hypothetical protein [Fibrisoma montanum]RIV18470.1 hypothetical protein DYU11_28255 [Fibrisoma montanum]
MKQPDEPLDQWVRQALNDLPDTPPPGSAFNADQVWRQMHPSLPGAAPQRRVGTVWWLAAACAAVLLISWLYLELEPAEKVASVTNRPPAASTPTNRPVGPLALRQQTAVRDPSAKAVRERTVRRVNVPESNLVEQTELTEAITAMPAETLRIAAKTIPSTPEVPKALATVPKRQFRVVHANELQAEDEKRPKLYQTENFVRLGDEGELRPDEGEIAKPLILRLTNKPNQ